MRCSVEDTQATEGLERIEMALIINMQRIRNGRLRSLLTAAMALNFFFLLLVLTVCERLQDQLQS
jgi:hypothetical protein